MAADSPAPFVAWLRKALIFILPKLVYSRLTLASLS